VVSFDWGVSEDRVLKKISGPKRDKVRVVWRKLHNEEFHNLHSSPNITMIKSRRGRACSVNVGGETRYALEVLVSYESKLNSSCKVE
jgi:hypothetical protein